MIMSGNINHLSANSTKWLNTLKQFVGCCWRIVWLYLTILWGWRLEDKRKNTLNQHFWSFFITETIIKKYFPTITYLTIMWLIYWKRFVQKMFIPGREFKDLKFFQFWLLLFFFIKVFDAVLSILKTTNLNLSQNVEHDIHVVSK